MTARPELEPIPGPTLTDRQFETIGALVHSLAGIHLGRGKEQLVQSRLGKRLRALGLADFGAYLELLEGQNAHVEIVELLDAIATNKTSFFREADHFRFLQGECLPPLALRATPVSIWCAGCSSGQEPYTLAMVAMETLGNPPSPDVRILATDISTKILRSARSGKYREQDVSDIPVPLLRKYFAREPGERDAYRVSPSVSAMVRFARLNLMGQWPMKGPFDFIFCRNVMIYFDRQTQENLVRRYSAMLAPGGYLFVGQSESLTSLDHDLKYVKPAVYRKPS